MESHVGNSVLDHFSSLSDPRIELKSSHILVEIVAMALCGIIAGADNWVLVLMDMRLKKDVISGAGKKSLFPYAVQYPVIL